MDRRTGKSNPSAEFDLLFRKIDPLGIIRTTQNEASGKTNDVIPAVDIDFVVPAERKKYDPRTDVSAEYNPIGVASGRFMQATGASKNYAPIVVRPLGGGWVRGRRRRFLGRALPH